MERIQPPVPTACKKSSLYKYNRLQTEYRLSFQGILKNPHPLRIRIDTDQGCYQQSWIQSDPAWTGKLIPAIAMPSQYYRSYCMSRYRAVPYRTKPTALFTCCATLKINGRQKDFLKRKVCLPFKYHAISYYKDRVGSIHFAVTL